MIDLTAISKLFSANIDIVRSNTRNVHSSVTPSAAPQLKCRLCPHEGIKSAETALYREREGLRILESKGTGRCCYSMLLQ